jgi:hypothetical protein
MVIKSFFYKWGKQMKRFNFHFAIFLLILLMSGCTTYKTKLLGLDITYVNRLLIIVDMPYELGLIYSHTTKPLDLNMLKTPSGIADSKGSVHHISYQGNVLWGNNSIAEIAKQKGLESVYYADIETLRIMFGTYSRYTIHVYGK